MDVTQHRSATGREATGEIDGNVIGQTWGGGGGVSIKRIDSYIKREVLVVYRISHLFLRGGDLFIDLYST